MLPTIIRIWVLFGLYILFAFSASAQLPASGDEARASISASVKRADQAVESQGFMDMEQTIIEADYAELVSTDEENFFTFKDNVEVIGNKLIVKCDYLEVLTDRTGSTDETVGEIGSILSIVAVNNVEVYQAGRQAFCGRAVVYPREEKVVLYENPIVMDSEASVTGCIIELLKGEQKARVIPCDDAGNPEIQKPGQPKKRATITLDGIQDISPDSE